MQERSKGNVNQGRMVINKSGIEYEDKIFEMRKELNWIIEWRIPIRTNSQKIKLKNKRNNQENFEAFLNNLIEENFFEKWRNICFIKNDKIH